MPSAFYREGCERGYRRRGEAHLRPCWGVSYTVRAAARKGWMGGSDAFDRTSLVTVSYVGPCFESTRPPRVGNPSRSDKEIAHINLAVPFHPPSHPSQYI